VRDVRVVERSARVAAGAEGGPGTDQRVACGEVLGSVGADEREVVEDREQVDATRGSRTRPARFVEDKVVVGAAAGGDLGPGQACGGQLVDGVAEEGAAQSRQVRAPMR
jgi:hypothetical protein